MAQALPILRANSLAAKLVNTDFDNVPAASGQSVNVRVPMDDDTTYAVAPGSAPIGGDDLTPKTVAVTLNEWRRKGFVLTDKEIAEVGAGVVPMAMQTAVKALANYTNRAIYAAYKGVSQSAGTAGTNPFAAGTGPILDARKILNSSLAPMTERRVVLDVEAEAKAFTLSDIARYDARGQGDIITNGIISRTYGMDWFMDQLAPVHTAGIPGGPVTASAAAAAGATSVSVTGMTASTGTYKAGDLVSFAGQSGTYAVAADVTASGTGTAVVTLAKPLAAAVASGAAVSLTASHTSNLVFHRSAIAFASRPLAAVVSNPQIFSVSDPQSGLTLRVEYSRQNKQDLIDFDILFGVKLVRPELAVRLLG